MSKHTPGPWYLLDGKNDNDVRADRPTGKCELIACSYAVNCADGSLSYTEETYANARLIAAAPELLAALDDLLNKCEAHFKPTGFPPSFHAGVYGSTLDKARAAVAKATKG